MAEVFKSISNLALSMQDKETRMARAAGRRNEAKLKQEIFQKSREGRHETPWGNPMKMIKVTSNYARNRTIMVAGGQLILHFDQQGVAELPEHKLDLLKAEMRVRPNRYFIQEVEQEAPKVVVEDRTKVVMKAQVENLIATLAAEASPEPVDEEDLEPVDLEPELMEEE